MALTQKEQEDLKKILKNIFGNEVDNWAMTEGTLKATEKMLQGLRGCSKAMNYVPRPEGVINSGYLKRQLRNIARRAGNEEFYEICKVQAGRNWKTIIAGGGLTD